MTVKLDLSGTYDIRIFVVGSITFGNDINVLVSTDGSTYTSMAALTEAQWIALGPRVYWESHGNFSGGNTASWFGTVYTPQGSLAVGNGGFMVGSYYSGGGHNIQGSTVYHVPANYFLELED